MDRRTLLGALGWFFGGWCATKAVAPQVMVELPCDLEDGGVPPWITSRLQTFSQSAKEMDFTQSREQMSAFCLALFGVPSAVALDFREWWDIDGLRVFNEWLKRAKR